MFVWKSRFSRSHEYKSSYRLCADFGYDQVPPRAHARHARHAHHARLRLFICLLPDFFERLQFSLYLASAQELFHPVAMYDVAHIPSATAEMYMPTRRIRLALPATLCGSVTFEMIDFWSSSAELFTRLMGLQGPR